jgi:hypothetical protein
MNEKILKAMSYLRDGYTEAAYEILEELTERKDLYPIKVSPEEFIQQASRDVGLVGRPVFWAEWPTKEK